MATELVHVVKEVSQERAHRLVTDKNLGWFTLWKDWSTTCLFAA